MMRNMFAKYFGRGTRDLSTISRSSSSSSAMVRVWKEEKTSWLVLAFSGGYLGHAFINDRKKKARWDEVGKMLEEYHKRNDAVSKRLIRYYKGKIDDP